MADISDVMDALALIAEGACYPNGLTSTSILGPPVSSPNPNNPSGPPLVKSNAIDIAQGWPMADDVDEAMAAGRSLVTIYPLPSTASAIETPMDTNPGTIVGPVCGLAAQSVEQGFTLFGKPYPGEYVTVILNGSASYSYAALPGDLPGTVCTFLAQAIEGAYPGTVAEGATLTIPGSSSIVVRIGAPATVGQIIGRQRQMFRITAWCSNPADRATIGRALNVALWQNFQVDLPDTSQMTISRPAQSWSDERQNVSIYRGDNVVPVQWDTLNVYPAYEITAVNVSFSTPDATTSVVG